MSLTEDQKWHMGVSELEDRSIKSNQRTERKKTEEK